MNKYKSATHYVLLGLIPYTDANLKLAFKPSLFFSELEKMQSIKPHTARSAFRRAVRQRLVELDDDNVPRLTSKGRRAVVPFTAKKLSGAKLMIVFDIPEHERWKRRHLRSLLKELSFVQVQKSVWMTGDDFRDYLQAEIRQLDLQKYVQIFEAREL